MAQKFFRTSKNTKPRVLLLLVGMFGILTVVGLLLMNRESNPLQTQGSTSSKIPAISAIPGNVTSEKYQSLQEEDNRRRTAAAQQSGGSAIATIIGARNKDALEKNQSLGIEDQLGQCPRCACENNTEASPAPNNVCPTNPDLAIAQAEHNKAMALKLLNDCPSLAKAFAQKNPALFKELLLENPTLAKRLGETNSELIKQLLLSDPVFAKQFATSNPEALKALLKNDPDFVEQLAKVHPEILKDLISHDPEFAKTIANNNPALLKKMILEDPAFAKIMAMNNPEALKALLKNDPEFTEKFANQHPGLFKTLLKNDPAFANIIGKQNAALLKKLMLSDPEFARALANNNPQLIQELMNQDPDFKKQLLDKVPGIQTLLDNSPGKSLLDSAANTFNNLPGLNGLPGQNDRQRALSIEEIRNKQQEARAQAARQTQLNEQQQKQIALLTANMETESKVVLKNLSDFNNQQFIQGDQNKKDIAHQEGAASNATDPNSSASKSSDAVLIKAGTILYASLDTAVNSDEPGPVMGTVVQGDFKGSKVIGALQMAPTSGGNRPEKVVLNFTTLNSPNKPKSLEIKAVAVDPDSARTALATDVDHHYLLRYGTLLGSSFIAGYGKVIASQGTTQVNSGTGATTTQTPQLDGKQQIYAAMGQVGQSIGEATSNYFNTPNTIKVEQGTGFGLLILSDVSDS